MGASHRDALDAANPTLAAAVATVRASGGATLVRTADRGGLCAIGTLYLAHAHPDRLLGLAAENSPATGAEEEEKESSAANSDARGRLISYKFIAKGVRWECKLSHTPLGAAGEKTAGGVNTNSSSSSTMGGPPSPTHIYSCGGDVPVPGALRRAGGVELPRPVVEQLIAITLAQMQTKQPLFFPRTVK